MEWMEPRPQNLVELMVSEKLPESDRETLRANPGRWARFIQGVRMSDSRRSNVVAVLRKAGLEGRTVSVLDAKTGKASGLVDVFVRAPAEKPAKSSRAKPRPEKLEEPRSFRTKDLPVLEQVTAAEVGDFMVVTFDLPDGDVSMARINTAATLQATAYLAELRVATEGPNHLKVSHEDRTITVKRRLRGSK